MPLYRLAYIAQPPAAFRRHELPKMKRTSFARDHKCNGGCLRFALDQYLFAYFV
jgi:hypothetical protein